MSQVIITGGRDYDDEETLNKILDLINPMMVIQGGATGADKLAAKWARDKCCGCITIPAEWDKYGKSAGPKRNRKMLDLYPDAIVLAFPGGKGTKDCVDAALARKRIVLKVTTK